MHEPYRSNPMGSSLTSRLFLAIIVLFCTQGVEPAPSPAAQSLSDQVSELLHQKLEPWKTPPPKVADATPVTTKPLPKLPLEKEHIHAAFMLSRFYEERGYRPAWSDDTGPLSRTAALIDTIQEEAEREGLRPKDYRLAKLKTFVQEVRQHYGDAQQSLDPRTLADLDLLLTDTFLTYGAHVSVGKVNLDKLDAQWFERHQKADLVQVLQSAVQDNRIADTIKALPPQHPGYGQLRKALAQYRGIVAHGSWPLVPEGPKLRLGDSDGRVIKLRVRLQVTGELVLKSQKAGKLSGASSGNKGSQRNRQVEKVDNESFDQAVERAVRRFQRRHGLSADGIVGDATLAALNVSAADRVQQLAVNLRRWRALPTDLGPRHIDVNIPNFTLTVVENDQVIMSMKVVVGKMVERRSTPAFNTTMTHLVLNPYWYVPKSIAEKELFPLSRKDPQYFTKHGFALRRIPVGEKQIPDPHATDGSMIATKTYQNVLRQEPGPANALGRVKFMLPNPYGVYLHDTPSKVLFNRAVRTFSHGCIRIEKPIDLAEYVLRGAPEWTRDSLLATLERSKEKIVWLPEPIPVYLQYWTAWVDREGTVQFRNDIYGYDRLPGTRLPLAKPVLPQPQAATEIQPTVQPETPPAALPASQPAPPPEAQSTW